MGSSSPYGTSPGGGGIPGTSPPVGSVPISFPHFQHPSHALLEDNGFKQQKWVAAYLFKCSVLLAAVLMWLMKLF